MEPPGGIAEGFYPANAVMNQNIQNPDVAFGRVTGLFISGLAQVATGAVMMGGGAGAVGSGGTLAIPGAVMVEPR